MQDIYLSIKNGIVQLETDTYELTSKDFFDIRVALNRYQSQLRRLERKASLEPLLSDAQWMATPAGTRLRGVCSCVYFMLNPGKPGLIKIGQTGGSVLSRLSRHEKALGYPSCLIIVALTGSPKSLERSFHAHFAEYLRDGFEWFEADPVLQYLKPIQEKLFGAKNEY